jgi:hypothetical protein
MRNSLVMAAIAAAAFSTPAFAVIDFESTPVGGYSSLLVDGVTFTSALGGASLNVGNFGVQSDGQGLAVLGDSTGDYLVATLASATTSVSLDFGNDDPFFTVPGDLAVLQTFLSGSLVGTVSISLTPDDILNQTIAFSGAAFDSFTFAYTNALGSPFTGGGAANVGLIEIVDNVVIAAVPEPASWAMMIAGFGLVGGALRRRETRVALAI